VKTVTIPRDLVLVVVQCCNCAVEYGIPNEMNEHLLEQKDKKNTFCPNGHQWHYTGKGSLQRALDAERRAEQAEQELRRLKASLPPKPAGQQCPVCKLYFARLSTHRTRMKHWGST
jgi:hypothetical protein